MYLKKYLMTIAAALCMLPLSAINPQNSKMKELNVKKVSVANIPVESVPALLDEEKVAFQPVNTVNWAAFPYAPSVEFRLVLQPGHRLKIPFERLDISIKIVLHPLTENQQGLVDRVEELVDVTYNFIDSFLV